MDWLKCKLCFNTYNVSNFRPHSLNCGHTYCERCLENTIQNHTLTCPQCGKNHRINTVLDIPINFNLEGLLKSLSLSVQDVTEKIILKPNQEKTDTDCKREPTVCQKILSDVQEKYISQKELQKIGAGVCNEHQHKECLFRCSVHMCWVCENCIEGGDHPKNKCKILSYKEEIELRKQEHKQSIDSESESCNFSFKMIDRHISFLRDKRETHISLINHLEGVLDMHKRDENDLNSDITYFQRILEGGKLAHQRLLDSEITVMNAVNLDESNAARDLIKNKTTVTRLWMDTCQREVNEGKEKIASNEVEVIKYNEKYKDINESFDKINNNNPLSRAVLSAYIMHSNNEDTKIYSENLADLDEEKKTIEETRKEELPAIVGGIQCFGSPIPKKNKNAKVTKASGFPTSLEGLVNEKGKKKEKEETQKEALSEIVGGIRHFAKYEPKKNIVEIFRVKIILRLLQLSFCDHTACVSDENANRTTYVGKEEMSNEMILRWIKEDMDDVWASQHGKRHVLTKDIHGIISNLILDISPEQFDHFYASFQTIWNSSSMEQRKNLLELSQTFFREGRYREMADKILSVLWILSHSGDMPTKMNDQAIYAHVKIIDSMSSNFQKEKLLDCCVEELKQDKHVLIALKYIREVILIYSEEPSENPDENDSRPDVVVKLQNQYAIVSLVVDNLTIYMKQIYGSIKGNQSLIPEEIFPDGHYNHIEQIYDRLSFLQFILQEGDLWICKSQAEQIWNCLVENAAFAIDRDTCFKWFSALIKDDDQDLDPSANNRFFNKIMNLDPSMLTINGMECFTKFFKVINKRKIELVLDGHLHHIEDKDLIGHDYLWRIILRGNEDVADSASKLLRETFITLSLQPKIKINNVLIHDYFISKCMIHLEAIYNNGLVLGKRTNSSSNKHEESMQMCKVLTVLYKYLLSCDREFVKSGYNISHKFPDMLKKYSAANLYHMSNIFIK